MDSRSRKRQASDTSLGQSDTPKAKRRKKHEKSSSQSSDLSSSSSTQILSPKISKSLTSVTRHLSASHITEPHPLSQSALQPSKPASKSSSKAKKSASGASRSATVAAKGKPQPQVEAESGRRTESSGSQGSASNAPGSQGTSNKTTRSRKKGPHKPQNGSWMTHIASILVYRCVGQALVQSFDPRGHIKEFKWDFLSDGLLTPDDLQMVWFFIEREYPDMSLKEVSEKLKPFSKLTMEPFLREEMKEKYKDEVPKPPVSAYLLFCKSKGPKLKEKHPDLNRPQMAKALGKKWRSMGAEKQDKYRQQYAKLRKEYVAKLERFYEEHPDAKPSAFRSRRRNDSKAVYLTPEERRIKLLKSECPKLPLSAYMLFCKAKREKVHQKHPTMSSKEVTVKLSKRWKSMDEEGKMKYKRMNLESSKVYKLQLKEFYEKYPDAQELLKRKRKRKEGSGSATAATQTSIQRDLHDTFYSSDESPVSPVHHTHTDKGGESSSDEGSSSSEDEEKEREERSKVVKGGRRAGGNNERGTQGGKSGSESESESSSSSEEDEGDGELEGRGVGGGGGRKQQPGQSSRSKEKVVSTPMKKSLTAGHSSPLKSASAGSTKTALSSRSTPSKKLVKSSSSESEDSGEETDISDFI